MDHDDFSVREEDVLARGNERQGRIDRGLEWLKGVAESHGKGGPFRYSEFPERSARGEFCGVFDGFAALRLRRRARSFRLVALAEGQKMPRVGAMVSVAEGAISLDRETGQAALYRASRNEFPVARNRALVAKLCEVATAITGSFSLAGPELAAPADLPRIVETLGRAHKSVKGFLGGGSFHARYFFFDGVGSWRINGASGWVDFLAPSPDDVLNLVNAQRACERERRALSRVGKKAKAPEVPARRPARL
jgi:hypothetical protein